MGAAQNDLIYDVGLFNGDDTAYYLFRGYKVVALDANPITIERARSRFSEEIATGRLTLLNIGISEKEGLETLSGFQNNPNGAPSIERLHRETAPNTNRYLSP